MSRPTLVSPLCDVPGLSALLAAARPLGPRYRPGRARGAGS